MIAYVARLAFGKLPVGDSRSFSSRPSKGSSARLRSRDSGLISVFTVRILDPCRSSHRDLAAVIGERAGIAPE